MSVNVEKGVDAPGETDHLDEAWDLKERIREEEGVLKQREGFFRNAYRRARSHLLFVDDDLAAFASVRTDGYILFLAVVPEWRGEGFGRRLIAEIADDHRTVTCHARTTNDDALRFYDRVGFDIQRRVDGYYEDGGDAYYLRLGENGGIRDRLSELLGR